MTCEDDILWQLNDAGQCVHKDLLPYHYIDFITTILILLITMLSAVAGIGGSGMLIPIYILVGNFKTKYGIILSQMTIIGNSLGRIALLIGARRENNPNKYLIDYRSILLIIPFNANASFMGFVANAYSPTWLVIMTIVILLVISLYQIICKGLAEYRRFQNIRNRVEIDGMEQSILMREIVVDGIEIDINNEHYLNVMGTKLETWRTIARYMAIIFLLFGFISVANLIRQQVAICSPWYWGGYVIQCFIVLAIGLAIGYYNIYSWRQENENMVANGDGGIKWTWNTVGLYFAISSVVGILATYVGMGGSTLLSQMLLHIGLPADVMTGTMAVTNLFSATASILQYIGTDRILTEYCFYFMAVGFISSFLGLKTFRYWFGGRNYIIIFILAGLIAISCVLLVGVGIQTIIQNPIGITGLC